MNPQVRILAAAALLLALLSDPAAAQYFGQNKVQYDDFDWRIIHSEHFDLHFYGDMEEPSARMAPCGGALELAALGSSSTSFGSGSRWSCTRNTPTSSRRTSSGERSASGRGA